MTVSSSETSEASTPHLGEGGLTLCPGLPSALKRPRGTVMLYSSALNSQEKSGVHVGRVGFLGNRLNVKTDSDPLCRMKSLVKDLIHLPWRLRVVREHGD